MALDPTIPLRAMNNRLAQQDPMRNTLGAMKIAQTRQQMQAQQRQMQLAEQQRQRLAQIADMPEGERMGAVREYQLRSGDVSGWQASRKSELKESIKRLSIQKDKTDMALRGLSLVSTQPQYDQWASELMRSNPDLAGKLPAQYTPQLKQQLMSYGLSISEQFTRDLNERKFEFDQRYKGQKLALEAAGSRKPVTYVGGTTVQMPGETVAVAEAKAFGKALSDRFTQTLERGDAAESVLGSLYTLKNIDVTTGALEPARAWVSSIASSLGFDPNKIGLEDATNAQSFVGIAQNLVLNKMQQQKGPQTESDARRIEQTVASLGNTPEATQFLLDTAIAINEREVERRDFYEAWLDERSTTRGASKAWNDFKRTTPLLAKNPNTGRPVFFNQFKKEVQRANPNATQEQIVTLWREKYGGSN